MSDDTSQRGPQDGLRINMTQAHEVRYWTQALGVTESELSRAVGAVGSSADNVCEFLGNQGASRSPSSTH